MKQAKANRFSFHVLGGELKADDMANMAGALSLV
jgi:hypothetical protein